MPMARRRFGAWLILPLLVAGLWGCETRNGGSSSPGDPVGGASDVALRSTTWRLERFGEDGPSTDGIEITLVFEDDRISGSSGCNRYSAAIETLDAGRLVVGKVVSTRRACPPEIMNAEHRYLATLDATIKWNSTTGQLVLRGEGDAAGRLVFAAVIQ